MKKLSICLAILLSVCIFFSACGEKTAHYSDLATFEVDILNADSSKRQEMFSSTTVTFKVLEIIDAGTEDQKVKASDRLYFTVDDKDRNPADLQVGDIITVKIYAGTIDLNGPSTIHSKLVEDSN